MHFFHVKNEFMLHDREVWPMKVQFHVFMYNKAHKIKILAIFNENAMTA